MVAAKSESSSMVDRNDKEIVEKERFRLFNDTESLPDRPSSWIIRFKVETTTCDVFLANELYGFQPLYLPSGSLPLLLLHSLSPSLSASALQLNLLLFGIFGMCPYFP